MSAIRDDSSAVIVNSPSPEPGEFLTQSQVGVQSRRSRTWLAAQTGSPPRQAIAAAARGGKLWKPGESPGISAVYASGSMLGWTLPPKSAQEAAPVRVTKWRAP